MFERLKCKQRKTKKLVRQRDKYNRK